MSRLITIILLLSLSVLTACMYSPTNESIVATKETSISFYGISPNDDVYIYAAPTIDSEFGLVGDFTVDETGSFSGNYPVPIRYWRPMCDRSGGWETFVRGQNLQGTPLLSYDAFVAVTTNPSTVLVTEVPGL